MIPPIVDDPRAVNLTVAQRHTLVLLPLALDDFGRTLDDSGRINGLLWGSLWREHGPDELDADLAALDAAGLITRYEVDGVRYLQMQDWDSQQVISRRGPSRYPAPPSSRRGPGRGEQPGFRSFGQPGFGKAGPFAGRGASDAVWDSVEGLMDYVASATEKLGDPSVQTRAVSFLADLAGQVDPNLGDKVREQASLWIGSAAYEGSGQRRTHEDVVRLKVVKQDVDDDAADATPYDTIPDEVIPDDDFVSGMPTIHHEDSSVHDTAEPAGPADEPVDPTGPERPGRPGGPEEK
jgi:hypothetical protein